MASLLQFPSRSNTLPPRSRDALARQPDPDGAAAQARRIAQQVESEIAVLAARQAVGLREEFAQVRAGNALVNGKTASWKHALHHSNLVRMPLSGETAAFAAAAALAEERRARGRAMGQRMRQFACVFAAASLMMANL